MIEHRVEAVLDRWQASHLCKATTIPDERRTIRGQQVNLAVVALFAISMPDRRTIDAGCSRTARRPAFHEACRYNRNETVLWLLSGTTLSPASGFAVAPAEGFRR